MEAFYFIIGVLVYVIIARTISRKKFPTLERLAKESSQIKMIQLYGEDYEHTKT